MIESVLEIPVQTFLKQLSYRYFCTKVKDSYSISERRLKYGNIDSSESEKDLRKG